MKLQRRWLVFIALLSAFSVWMALPSTNGTSLDLNFDGEAETTIEQPLGLDLVGGLRVLLQAELPAEAFTEQELRETANSVSRRINSLGLTDATVQTRGRTRILVELPGVSDPEQAIGTIQQTALLEFVDFGGLGGQAISLTGQQILTDEQNRVFQQRLATAPDEEERTRIEQLIASRNVNPNTGQPFNTVMTGAGLEAAAAVFSQQEGGWLIEFELNDEGGDVFGPYTRGAIGQPMAIVLDGQVLSAPTIQAELPTGGVITGNFTEEEANTLALQLRSGSLQIPLRVESTQQVGATLGQESVALSIQAGIIGTTVILLFMIIYYRALGVAAALALLVFISLNLTLYKLVPVTLTLPAIAGFIISIGTAVDGSILIFERIKEELRNGTPFDEALNEGFDRAWTSIRDSNLSTIIVCTILFFFGQTPGASIVSAFATTLFFGLVINLFTAVIVTKTFLSVIVNTAEGFIQQRAWTLGV